MFLPSDYTLHPESGMWRATTAQSARAVLVSPELTVTDLRTYYTMLAEEVGRDFPLIRHYLHYLTLINDGPHHLALRKLAAAQFNKSGAALRETRAQLINDAQARLSTDGPLEIMASVVRPAAVAITHALAGTSANFVASDILSPRRSLRKNRAIEAQLGKMQIEVAANFPDEDEDTRAMRITLALLGTEPLTAGLGAAFLSLLQEHSGKRLCDIDWPDDMQEPAVLFAVRFAPTSLPAATCPMRAFEIETRLMSDPKTGGKRGDIFGHGAHSCMGRGVSMIFWRELTARLATLKTRIELTSFEPATHWLFNSPKSINVRISHDPR